MVIKLIATDVTGQYCVLTMFKGQSPTFNETLKERLVKILLIAHLCWTDIFF